LAVKNKLRFFLRTEFPEFSEQIEIFAHDALDAYLTRIDAEPPREKKHVNDPVWQTIGLNGTEVIILDAPIMQRLRRIRQLGVAHLLFPGVGYSRLEHSIGTVHTMQMLCQSISQHDGGKYLSPDECQALRIAALLHDIGHCCFSHVTEPIYGNFSFGEHKKKLSEICEEVGAEFLCKPSPSELLSAAIIVSDPFEKLLIRAQARNPFGKRITLCEWIALTIMGSFSIPEKPMLTQLLTGPFDADKLDYMARDCRNAGIPLQLDIARLVQKLRITQCKVALLPVNLQGRMDCDLDKEVEVIGIALSGSSALDEMSFARVTLYQKLYQHSKVRAAESLLRRAINCILEERPETKKLSEWMKLDDENVVSYGMINQLDPPDERALSGANYCRQYRERHIPRRAAAFRLIDKVDNKRPDHKPMVNFQKKTLEVRARTLLEQKITKTANSIVKIFGKENNFSEGDIYLSRAKTETIHTSSDIFLIDHKNQPILERDKIRDSVRSQEDDFAAPRWADAYFKNKTIDYVFCQHRELEIAHLATRLVLAHEYDYQLSDRSKQICKLDDEDLQFYFRKLDEHGYLDKTPQLKPISKTISKSSNRKRLVDLSKKRFSHFKSYSIQKVSGDDLMQWVNQFREENQEALIDLLGRFVIYERNDFVNALKAVRNTPLDDDRHIWVKLSSSAQLLSYYSRDTLFRYYEDDTKLLLNGLEDGLSLTDALRQDPNAPLVFYDDCFGSATQALDIFRALLGMETHLNEVHVAPLTPEERTDLLSRKISLFFPIGTRHGEQRLNEALAALGLDLETILVGDYLDSDVFEDMPEPLIEELRETGCALLRRNKNHWTEAMCRERALGYDTGHPQLFAFHYNVPAFTLPVIWLDGDIDDGKRTWRALLPRRPRIAAT